MRTYERTHPWITFSIDLQKAHPNLWIALGECKSKCEHIAGVPLPPEMRQELHSLYLAKGVNATTTIEGNTLTEDEVLKQIDGELELPPSREYLKQETQNIIDECNSILEHIKAGEQLILTVDRIKEINRKVLNELRLKSGVIAGEIRDYSVGVEIARYRGAPPEDCEYLVGKLCDWLNSPTFDPTPGNEIIYATLKSILAHLYLAWIHPFGDGNGRTARLIEFQILISSGVPAPAAHLLSNHYNQTRSEYYLQLDKSSKSGGEVLPFISYAVEGFRDGLLLQLEIIKYMQLDVMWRDYVYDAFRNKTTQASGRRRRLLLDLSSQAEPVPVSEISGISRRLAIEYASKTKKTINRDINVLDSMGLIEISEKGIKARKEIILKMLPIKAVAPSP
jgi:Fic family protein